MRSTLFIIPGFREKISHKQYVGLRNAFPKKDFDVVLVPIVWDRRVMTDWIDQFSECYESHRGKKNIVLGFSYGAMIALLTAKTLRPDRLILCSLSPYFAEDLPKIPMWWKRFIGKRRTEDFSRYSMKKAVKGISITTTVFIGGGEQKKFPQLKRRCVEGAKELSASLIVVPNVLHDIGDPRYRVAIVREVR